MLLTVAVNVTGVPTLTVELLEAADHAALDAETRRQVGAIQAAWSGQETTRALLRALPVAGPDVQWLEADGQPFLALSTQTLEGVRVMGPAPAPCAA